MCVTITSYNTGIAKMQVMSLRTITLCVAVITSAIECDVQQHVGSTTFQKLDLHWLKGILIMHNTDKL